LELSAASVASVAAPLGSGSAAAEIACVAGRFVIETLVCGFDIATVPDTGCVAGRFVTETLDVGFDTVTVGVP
jgi:hypothetical protein